MNARKWIAVSVVLGAFAALTCAVADDDTVRTTQTTETTRVTTTTEWWTTTTDEPFPSNQLRLDVFGTYATRNREGSSVNAGGGGLGVDYFFLRYVGIGADTYIEEW